MQSISASPTRNRYFRREEDAVERMNEALILTGISMGITGYTRPASGSEHHLAHYWELAAIERAFRIRSMEIP